MANIPNIVQKLRQTFGPKADHPAGVARSNVLDVIKKALDDKDPQRISQVLPQFSQMMQSIVSVLGTISMGSGSMSPASSGQQQQTANTANNFVANTAPPTQLTSSVIQDMANGM